MRRLAVVGLVVAALLASACGDKDEPLGPTATVPQGTTTTNPYAVPAVIDEAYVNRVLAGLDQAVGDLTRLIATSQALPPEVLERLRSIYIDEDQFQFEIQLFQSSLGRGFEGIRPDPGNRVTTVTELIHVAVECVFAKVDMDTSAVATTPNPAFRTRWIAIAPLPDERIALGNVTGWGLIYEGFGPDGTAPSDPCAER
ncbi:MAG: hypothetical protein QOG82_2254 [Actinomycetota bacterium]|nr:hypothetical protein [Actinomycetota bacterium]